jgi:hypothetical protein
VSSLIFRRATPKKDRELLDEHRESLVIGSHILPSIVETRGYYSVPRKSIEYLIDKKLFDSRLRSGTSWMGIPIYRPDGEHHGDIIRLFGSDLERKYLWPAGSRQAADIHPIGREEWLLDLDVPLVITEGIKKGDAIFSAAIEEDIPCLVIAVNGCWGWKARIGDAESRASIALPDFLDIPVTGRHIYIVSDSDYRSNNEVRAGWTEAALYFGSKRVSGKDSLSKLVVVPSRGIEKQGADDYLSTGGTLADLLALGSTPAYAMISYADVTPRALMYQTGHQVIATAKNKVPHLIDPIMPEKSIMVMAGHTGSYKSWHAMSLCLDAAFGLRWTEHPNLKHVDGPITSIYVNKEMGAQMIGSRLKQLAMSDRYRTSSLFEESIGKRIIVVGEGEADLDLSSEHHRQRLEELVVQTGSKILVLDSLSMCWSGDENNAAEVATLYMQLRGITDRTGVCWVIIHHLLKPQNDRKRTFLPDKYMVRGSGQIIQQADTLVLCAEYEPDEPVSDVKFVSVTHGKARTSAILPAWITKFQEHDGFYVTLEYSGLLSESRASAYVRSHGDPKKLREWMAVALQEVIAIQPTGSGIRSKDLIRLLQAAWPNKKGSAPSDSTLYRHLSAMTETGDIVVLDKNQRLGDLYQLPEVIPEPVDNQEDPAL